jgi:hypothetical protein
MKAPRRRDTDTENNKEITTETTGNGRLPPSLAPHERPIKPILTDRRGAFHAPASNRHTNKQITAAPDKITRASPL